MADENVDAQANKGGETNGAGGEDKLAAFEERFNTLEGELKDTKAKLADAERRLEVDPFDDRFLNQLEKQTGGGGGNSGSKQDGDGEIDLDTVSNTELVKHILSKVEDGMKITDQKLAQTIDYIAKRDAAADLERTMLRHSDLEEKLEDSDYKGRFYNVAKENPTWGANKVYKQVERDLKDEADAQAKAEADKAARERDIVTEKGGAPSSTFQGKDLSSEEIADRAYDKIFGKKEFVGPE